MGTTGTIVGISAAVVILLAVLAFVLLQKDAANNTGGEWKTKNRAAARTTTNAMQNPQYEVTPGGVQPSANATDSSDPYDMPDGFGGPDQGANNQQVFYDEASPNAVVAVVNPVFDLNRK